MQMTKKIELRFYDRSDVNIQYGGFNTQMKSLLGLFHFYIV